MLLDIDGTLVDTEPSWMAEEHALARAYGGSWSREQAVASVGNPIPVTAARLRDEGGVDLPVGEIVDRLLDGVVAAVGVAVPWQPGARDLIGALRAADVPLALVTMSYRRLADAVLADLPAATFAAVVTGDEVRRGKPHPEPYLTAAAAAGRRPRRLRGRRGLAGRHRLRARGRVGRRRGAPRRTAAATTTRSRWWPRWSSSTRGDARRPRARPRVTRS